MDIVEKILETITENPGIMAKDIARKLGLQKLEVNSALYGKLKNRVYKDQKHKWYPKGVSRPKPDATEQKKRLNTPLAKLSRYYLDCLSNDYTDGVSEFASSRYGLNYHQLSGLQFIEGNYEDIFEEDEAKRLLGKVRNSRGKLLLYMGYPTRVRQHRAKKGGTYLFLEPIFLFPFSMDSNSRYTTPSLSLDPPIFNFKALQNLITTDSGNVLDEAIQIAQELGLGELGEDVPEMDDILLSLKSIRPDWDWKEDIDPYNLGSEPHLSDIEEQGIYNRAVLLSGERSPYTQGLETELSKLSQIEESEYCNTALGRWLSNADFTQAVPEQLPLLEILPLNSEQRQAVLHGLQNQLTVITGPPGTGKSQVVTSILVNAAYRGQKVLFASKNNKAVDVVEVRVNALGQRPILLRLGRNEYQKKLADYLVQLLAATATDDDSKNYEHHKELHEAVIQKFQLIDEQLEEVINQRNLVDQIERDTEEIRSEVGGDLFYRLSQISLDDFQNAEKVLWASLNRAIKSKQSIFVRLFWGLVKKKRIKELGQVLQDISRFLESVDLTPPDTNLNDDTIKNVEGTCSKFSSRVEAAARAQEYFANLKQLQTLSTLEHLAEQRIKAIDELSDKSEQVWKSWLLLQPSRLTQEERRLLGEYSSLLQLIVTSNEDNTRIGRNVFAKYYSIFPKITNILSCWAITSLSARRIPFDPEYFDLIVIDEASQCDIASALPLLFRAKKAVIIGDPQQLRHISSLSKKQDQMLLEKHDVHALWAYSVNSLFDLASRLCRSEDIISLRDHHRSHSDIIDFSNKHFYEDRLRIATDYNKLNYLSRKEPAVRWIDVKGRVFRPTSGGAVNETEAKEVVKEIERLVLSQGYKGSIGVISPFRSQANKIRDLVHQNDNLLQKLDSIDFLADTVHRFQGDERDLMIFSPVVSSGVTDSALGFLRNNRYLFNVAITRARAALIVVGDHSAALNSNVQYLSKFALYVEDLKSKVIEPIHVGEDLGPEYPPVHDPSIVSDWERYFYKILYSVGLRPIPQYQVEKYSLDFALISGQRKLDIEVDGEQYHRNWDGELCRRDQIRNQRLIELGWDIMRFWVYEIRDDLQHCINRVEKWKAQK